jgi:phospholipid/cholesterol/gamma-HCH transport system substrate-binding protein
MREGVRNFMVGVTSIGGLGALAGLLMSFGELDRFTNPRYAVTVVTADAAGLRAGGGVEFNGVPVGVVNSVYTQSDDTLHPVRVKLGIDKEVALPSDVQASVATPLIGGSSLLRFSSPGRPADQVAAPLPKDGSAQVTAELSGGMFDAIAAALDERMKPLMESLEKFNKLADTFTSVGENVNTLMQPQSAEALASGEPPNLRTAVIKINTAIDEATEGLRLAREWLGDEQLRNDVRGSVTKAGQLIEQATEAVDRYAKLAASLETDANDLTKRLANVADQMARTLEDVQTMARKANAGEGSLGLMLNNPDLYNALTDAAVRLERTLVELQLFIQKVKAEGLPMKLF